MVKWYHKLQSDDCAKSDSLHSGNISFSKGFTILHEFSQLDFNSAEMAIAEMLSVFKCRVGRRQHAYPERLFCEVSRPYSRPCAFFLNNILHNSYSLAEQIVFCLELIVDKARFTPALNAICLMVICVHFFPRDQFDSGVQYFLFRGSFRHCYISDAP
jgi:hypothetical protein